MDAKKNDMLPSVDTKNYVFKLKLNVHNNTYLNINTGECRCYYFTEVDADLQASTHVSTTIDFITEQSANHPGEAPVILLSDTCVYANRNKIISNALRFLAKKLQRDIFQVFYIVGHSMMEIDAIHSMIERKKYGHQIFNVEEYVKLAEDARKGRKIETKVCGNDFFKDYKEIMPISSIKPKNHNVNDIVMIKYSKDGTVSCKTSYAEECWQVLYDKDDRIDEYPDRPQLFNEKIKIKYTKYCHLQSMLKVVPLEHHDFYKNLPHLK